MNCFPGMPCWQNNSSECSDCKEGRLSALVWFPPGCGPLGNISSTNILYSGPNLPNTAINNNDNLTLVLAKIDTVIGNGGGVPLTRILTINGVAQDLSADRVWNVGDLLSTGSYANPTWITSLAWTKITGAPTFSAAGSDTQIQYNSGGTFGASSAFTWDYTNNLLNIQNAYILVNPSKNNLFFGRGAGNTTATGQTNIGIGWGTLSALTTGSSNIIIGQIAAGGGSAITTGAGNVLISSGTSHPLTTGGQNVFIGIQTTAGGYADITGSQNVVIGNVKLLNSTANGQLNIQNSIYGTSNTSTFGSLSTGNIGIYVQSPTARLHVHGGSATANTAGIKLDSGTLLSTTEAGALENNGTHLYFTFANSGTRYQLDQQLTNSASNLELMMSDGTNAVHSGLFVPAGPTYGDLELGTSYGGSQRNIYAKSTGPDITLALWAKGAGTIALINGNVVSIEDLSSNAILLSSGSSGVGYIQARKGTTLTNPFFVQAQSGIVGDVNGNDIQILSGDGDQPDATGNSGNVYLSAGIPYGAGTSGNIGLHTKSGSFGGGHKVMFIANAATVPGSNPTGGGILYVEAGALKYRGSSGTVTTIANA